jgi:hypothetical protein
MPTGRLELKIPSDMGPGLASAIALLARQIGVSLAQGSRPETTASTDRALAQMLGLVGKKVERPPGR